MSKQYSNHENYSHSPENPEDYSGSSVESVISDSDPIIHRFGLTEGAFSHRSDLKPINNEDYHPVQLLERGKDSDDKEFENNVQFLNSNWSEAEVVEPTFQPHKVARRPKHIDRDQNADRALRPFDWGKVVRETSLAKLAIEKIESGAKIVDAGVGTLVRTLFLVENGDSTGQHLLNLPNRFAELLGEDNFKDLLKAVDKRKLLAVVALGAVVTRGVIDVSEKPSQPSTGESALTELVFQQSEQGGVFTSFDTYNQDIELSEKAAQMAGGLPELSVKIDTETSQIHFSKEAVEQGEEYLVAAVIAAAAPDDTPRSEQAIQKNPEDMNDQEYMQYLADGAIVAPEEYDELNINTDYEDVFKDELSGNRITPTKFVAHWTAVNYTRGVEGFIDGIKDRKGNCCSSMYFISKDNPTTYRFADSWEQMAHAYGANKFTQGVEIEAEGLRDLQPEQIKQLVMVAKRFMDANDIAISRENFVGHMEIDAEYGRGQKPDMPPELIDLIFEKLSALDQQTNDKQLPSESIQPSEKVEYNVNILLDKIAEHEGGWDSVNTGDAGDTKVGGDKYNQIFGGKVLSEMTLQEVLDMQANNQLFAVGRYQFVPDTLNDAVKYTGIDTSSIFNAETQNSLVRDSLLFGNKRKYLTAYLSGESDNIDEAVHDLCKEWASLPCIDGSGYYDGDSAGNNAIGGKERLAELKKNIKSIHDASIEAKQVPTTPESSVPKLPKLVMTGDSLTVGMQNTGQIEEVDENFGFEVISVNAREGRALAAGKDNGLDAMKSQQEAMNSADIVYLGYGTNAVESNESFEKNLTASVQKIKATDSNKKVVIPLLYSNVDEKDARNEIIKRVASANGANIIDVSGSVQLADDGVHPKNYQKVTEAVLTEISSITDQATTQPVPAQNIQNEPVETTSSTTEAVDASGKEAWISRDAALNAYRIFFDNGLPEDEAALQAWVDGLEVNDNGKVLVSLDNLPGDK